MNRHRALSMRPMARMEAAGSEPAAGGVRASGALARCRDQALPSTNPEADAALMALVTLLARRAARVALTRSASGIDADAADHVAQ